MILIVDDDHENRTSLKQVLQKDKWECLEAENGHDALQILRDNKDIQVLITDMQMPGINGLELLQMCRNIRPDVQRLLITAFGTIEATVEAMRAGAFDVLTKPVKVKAIRDTVKDLYARSPRGLPQAQIAPLNSNQFSPAYARLSETLRRAAAAEASVLLSGESGTGKTFLAKLLHETSPRREKPFVILNCAAIPADLLESELFGYEKGAFTGASRSQDGKIAAAQGGTLVLDEIGDMSLALQAKLLQFIQERKFYKLGSNKEVSVDLRIISASHRNLSELVKEGRFREDLLYRLKVIDIEVPSLRERKQDLLWLIPNLLDSLAEKNKLPPTRLSHEALAKLWSYDWPGNIRELENVLESTLVLCSKEVLRDGTIGSDQLPETFQNENSSEMPQISDLATIERQAINQALTLCGGKRKLAASLLGISERTLYRVLGAEKSI